jgi:HPt (histidine-containing phosphotransfer) domain-containing protein
MGSDLDLSRLAELRELLQAEIPELVMQMAIRISDALTRLDAALAADDLPAVADAAHAARNDALMLGTRRLLEALEAVELDARDLESQAAREALARVHLIWPEVRAAMQRVAGATDARP